MIKGMPREKTTITIDRAKVDAATALTDARSTSAVVDMALDHLIRAERLKRDIAAYTAMPPTEDEIALASLPVRLDLDDDDVDYDALYGDGS